MPGTDPAHWLLRLTSDEWLAAATHELALAEAALTRRAARPGITHARRAAGMAWNAVLVERPDPRAGRSYMEHVVALAQDPAAPPEVREAALTLRAGSSGPPELIRLGGLAPDDPRFAPVRAARRVLEHARASLGRGSIT